MVGIGLKFLGTVVFKSRRWRFDPLPSYWAEKQVIIGFPHSSWLDSVMAFSGFAMVGLKGHIIIKKESFRWPYGWWLTGLGGIPVDRSASTGVVEQMVAEFERRSSFQLALVPEGTRKGITRIKTGFWHIAKAAGVPIVCWYLDSANKRTRFIGRIEPSDDMDRDLAEIKRIYASAGHDISAIAS
jgi:1-acyl-sn-glycerol-3-phosphate acyltransferase